MSDWGEDANAPTFSLFGLKSTPQEQAELDTFVNPIVYNRWTKAERRLYNKLKTEKIRKLIEESRLETEDDLSACMDQLNLVRQNNDELRDPEIEALVNRVVEMKINRETD